MEAKTRILLVEDDINLGFLLVDHLEGNGFDVKLYRDGQSGLDGYKNGAYDFCILDVMLPKIDGFEVAKEIKKLNAQIPMMMLTARAEDEDKIRGFNIGVDDYVTKPFNETELVCRIKAILCRVGMTFMAEPDEAEEYVLGQFSFTCKNRTLDGGTEMRRLTKTEADILQILCRHKGNVVSRKEIMEKVWGEDDYFIGRSLDVFVSKIRKYLIEDSSINIETVPNLGLVLNA